MGTDVENEALSRSLNENLQGQNSMSYVWATRDSIYSNNVNSWIRGDARPPVQSRLELNQRTTAVSPSFDLVRFWQLAALLLPVFNISANTNWRRCTPSSVFNAAKDLLNHVSGYCRRARSRLRALARDQGARDIFAGAMDVILVLYALGFLLISMYQASVFQQL